MIPGRESPDSIESVVKSNLIDRSEIFFVASVSLSAFKIVHVRRSTPFFSHTCFETKPQEAAKLPPQNGPIHRRHHRMGPSVRVRTQLCAENIEVNVNEVLHDVRRTAATVFEEVSLVWLQFGPGKVEIFGRNLPTKTLHTPGAAPKFTDQPQICSVASVALSALN